MKTSTSSLSPLGFPPHFNSAMAYESSYQANIPALMAPADEWRKRHSILPVSEDERRVLVLDIDDQFDFNFREGALPVLGRSGTGAMDALACRTMFIYEHLRSISQIINSMDGHNPFQVFFPIAHIHRVTGEHPAPHTRITADVYRREYRANPVMASQLGVSPEWLTQQFIFYCEELERKGKHELYIWPYHCLLGSPGQRLAGLMEEARLFHSFVRGADNVIEVKGWIKLVEHYSIIAPEVMRTWDGSLIPGAKKNEWLIEEFVRPGKKFIMGEAASHCLAASADDIFAELVLRDRRLLKDVAILKDCTTSVVVPNVVDYTDEVERIFQRYQDMGVQVFDSTNRARVEEFILRD